MQIICKKLYELGLFCCVMRNYPLKIGLDRYRPLHDYGALIKVIFN